jgi:hypothetical protein
VSKRFSSIVWVIVILLTAFAGAMGLKQFLTGNVIIPENVFFAEPPFSNYLLRDDKSEDVEWVIFWSDFSTTCPHYQGFQQVLDQVENRSKVLVVFGPEYTALDIENFKNNYSPEYQVKSLNNEEQLVWRKIEDQNGKIFNGVGVYKGIPCKGGVPVNTATQNLALYHIKQVRENRSK